MDKSDDFAAFVEKHAGFQVLSAYTRRGVRPASLACRSTVEMR